MRKLVGTLGLFLIAVPMVVVTLLYEGALKVLTWFLADE